MVLYIHSYMYVRKRFVLIAVVMVVTTTAAAVVSINVAAAQTTNISSRAASELGFVSA